MASLDEVSLSIGELRGQVAMLTRLTADHNAVTGEIQQTVQQLSTDMEIVKSDVAAFKPVAAKVSKWEQRALGFGALAGLLGAVVFEKTKGWFG